MNEDIYAVYKAIRGFIERSEKCCQEDHSHEPILIDAKKFIRIFNDFRQGYAERYKKEKSNDNNTSK